MSDPPSLAPADCARLIREHQPVVAVTGAGLSTAAGLPDFRGPQGLYVTRRYDPERVFELAGFLADPEPFFDFSRDFLEVVESVEPTFSHRLLAAMEQQDMLSAVVTQNIDALHHRAGSRRVIEVHGSYWRSHCLECRQAVDLASLRRVLGSSGTPRCDCGGVLKPDVVLFGEPVTAMDEAAAAVAEAGCVLVLGSSLTVYPAAWLPEMATGPVVAVNLGEVGLSPGPDRYVVQSDLDQYLHEVSRHLGVAVE